MKLSQLIISPPPKSDASVDAWHRRWLDACEGQSLFDATVECGFCADRIAGAFVGGYQAAVRVLVPALVKERSFITLSVTEEEGNRPRHIKTQLTGGDALVLNGNKRWASLSDVSSLLLVAARRNDVAEEKPELVLVKVRTNAQGVAAELMPPTKFVPEIGHGRLSFSDVEVLPDDILPGDGYSNYIKPFRMIEDCYVSAANAACLLRVACESHWPADDCAALLAVIGLLRQAAELPVDDPVAHLLFDTARERLMSLVDMENPAWRNVAEEIRLRWQRDLPLFGIATMASGIRVERAKQRLFPNA